MHILLRAFVMLVVLAFPVLARAHAANPSLLKLDEVAPGRVYVVWKTPMATGERSHLVVDLSARCKDGSPRVRSEVPFGIMARWTARCEGGLAGVTVAVRGLDRSVEEVILRASLANGAHLTAALRTDAPEFVIPASPRRMAVVRSYVTLGVEHIASGVDHLAFVLGLVLLVGESRRLLAAVTAFTLAHSVTLTLASLHVVLPPTRSIEALIALSIVFLAAEVVQPTKQGAGNRPFAFAFGFGLLHGFGFASGLADVGLPESDIPLALLSFNVGVELGQLAFVLFVLLVGHALSRIRRALPVTRPLDRRAMAYAIGVLGAIWTCQRIDAFWS